MIHKKLSSKDAIGVSDFKSKYGCVRFVSGNTIAYIFT